MPTAELESPEASSANPKIALDAPPSSGVSVSCGQHVEQGQTIGYVGCTGHCFGPHLHFEVRIGGSPVDPLGYL